MKFLHSLFSINLIRKMKENSLNLFLEFLEFLKMSRIIVFCIEEQTVVSESNLIILVNPR